MSKLTTHVLDTSQGIPASNLNITLYKVLDADTLQEVSSHITNTDGRCDQPILSGQAFAIGQYLLRFHAGDYLRRTSDHTIQEPLFLDIIDIRFGINNANTHHHVPLLLSSFGYSTYKGS
jgi:5-hydroxyisourate hydrolase